MRLIVALLFAFVFVQLITNGDCGKVGIILAIKKAILDAIAAGGYATKWASSYITQLGCALQIISTQNCDEKCNMEKLLAMLMQVCGSSGGNIGGGQCTTCAVYWQHCPCYQYPCNPCPGYAPPCQPCYYNNMLLWPGHQPTGQGQCIIPDILAKLSGKKYQ